MHLAERERSGPPAAPSVAASGSRLRTLGRSLPLLLLAVACGSDARDSVGRPEPPERVFLFVVDTLRSDHLSAYDPQRHSPGVDWLARRGQVFPNAVASFHQTSMSMAALFTGRTPSLEDEDGSGALPWNPSSWCGLSRFARDGDAGCVPQQLTTLAERFRDAGYWTAAVNANRLLSDPYGYDQGFDAWVEIDNERFEPGTSPTPSDLARRARLRTSEHLNPKLLELLAGRPSDRFLLFAHWIDVHDWHLRNVSYAASVADFDQHFGELLQSLEEMHLLEDSLIVFTSDHGESLLEPNAIRPARFHNGNPAFEPQLRVPLIASPPIAEDPDLLVRSQDVAGLILRAAGLAGLDAPQELERDELFLSELHFQTYRRGRFKSAHRRGSERVFLFDLEGDAGETRDVAALHPEVLAMHGARVTELSRRLGSRTQPGAEIAPEDLEALRALGYAR